MKTKPLIKIMLLVLLGAAAVGGAYVYKQSVITQARRQVVDELRAVLRAEPGYPADAAYIDGLLEALHPAEFERAFTADGPTGTGGELRITQFHRFTIDAMIARAQSDRAERAAATLSSARDRLN